MHATRAFVYASSVGATFYLATEARKNLPEAVAGAACRLFHITGIAGHRDRQPGARFSETPHPIVKVIADAARPPDREAIGDR
jgi:hypothetical protein